MLFRGVVIEGVACAGKSTLLKALVEHPTFVERQGLSTLVLTEHHTQRVLEGLGPRASLRLDNHLDLLRAHTDYLRGVTGRLARMSRWTDERLANPRFLAVIERFHLTHVLSYPHVEWPDVAELDASLAEMGVHLCVLHAKPDEIRRRLRQDRPAGWGRFLTEPGHRDRLTGEPSTDQKAEHFVRQQESLMNLASLSRMSRIDIDTTTSSPKAVAARVLEVLVGDPQDR